MSFPSGTISRAPSAALALPPRAPPSGPCGCACGFLEPFPPGKRWESLAGGVPCPWRRHRQGDEATCAPWRRRARGGPWQVHGGPLAEAAGPWESAVASRPRNQSTGLSASYVPGPGFLHAERGCWSPSETKTNKLLCSWILSNLKFDFDFCHWFIIDSSIHSAGVPARRRPLSDAGTWSFMSQNTAGEGDATGAAQTRYPQDLRGPPATFMGGAHMTPRSYVTHRA